LFRPLAFVLVAISLTAVAQPRTPVKFGIDVLREEGFKPLAGKRVGLVANPASVDANLTPTSDLFKKQSAFKLVSMFGPEHGIYGDEYAGDKVADRRDPDTGIPIYSLYGKTRKPTPEMLRDLDVLVLDLQDIGSRSYTYISTMKVCMEAAAEQRKELVILDRPNPLSGVRVEGPGLKKGFESFVGLIDVPYVHGMTMGELAQYVQRQSFPEYKQLRVVKMEGWRREMVWQDTGREWVPTSPHLPKAETCAAYAATGVLGELYVISNGVGYTLPFEIVGAPWVNGASLADALNGHWRDPMAYYAPRSSTRPAAKAVSAPEVARSPAPEGVRFRAVRFKPFYATFKTEPCQGVQVHVDPRTAGTLVEVNYRLLQALDAKKILAQAEKRHDMFDKVSGSDEVRLALSQGRPLEPIFEAWKRACGEFNEARKPFLLYP
jgi:uncharacterized protein YbbC (DUF1343 family)